uniref:Uncharacterized protein n=1 Tax=Prolemur simus TaxID=1328070 RepID=A0A8C8ZZK7_PROSS
MARVTGGSLVAVHDCHRRPLGSASSSSSSGRERRVPWGSHPYPRVWPRLTQVTGGRASFSGKSTLPSMTTVVESPEHSEAPQASRSMTTCGVAREGARKQPGSTAQPACARVRPCFY